MNCPHSSDSCKELQSQLDVYKMCVDEFLKKTEWVQEKTDWPANIGLCGQHRADVMTNYIRYLERLIYEAKFVLSKCIEDEDM